MRNDKPLKSVERWLKDHADMIDEYWIERDEFEDNSPYSYWIYLKPGWINTQLEAHLIHEATARDAIAHLESIAPCDCDDCTSYFKP